MSKTHNKTNRTKNDMYQLEDTIDNKSPRGRQRIQTRKSYKENYIEKENYYSDYAVKNKRRREVYKEQTSEEQTFKSQEYSQSNSNSEEEADRLPDEVYQIVNEIYSAHINHKDIKENVILYRKNVKDFCMKVTKEEIILFIKIFAEKVNLTLRVTKYYIANQTRLLRSGIY